MTADHPTREERYAAVIEAHGPLSGGWFCACQPLDEDGCRETLRSSWPAHVAAALVAADCADGTSAEVSPERSSGESPAPAQCCDGTSQELSRGGVPRETPDAALSDEWAEAFLREWSRPAAVLRAARAAQPACCDGTSQEVSSQQDRDESPAPEVSRGVELIEEPENLPVGWYFDANP